MAHDLGRFAAAFADAAATLDAFTRDAEAMATTSDRIQEGHIKILHIVIEVVERRLFPANDPDS